MPQDNAELLRAAIARNGGLVISLPDRQGLLHHHKSRFLGEAPEGLWMEPVTGREIVEDLVASGREAGFSFKDGNTKIVFASPILRREAGYAINAELTLEALLVRHPTDLRAVQRRASYRAGVVADSELSIRIWRIGRGAYLNDRPTSSQEIRATCATSARAASA